MSTSRRQRAERFIAREDDVTIHMPAGAAPVPGLEQQTAGTDDPADRVRRRRRGVGLGALREQRGLTQTALADQLGMRQGDISNIERRPDPKVSTIERYARWLDSDATIEVVVHFKDGRTTTLPV